MQPPLAAFLEQVLATAQAGLTYSQDPFDIARFEALRNAAATLVASQSELDPEAIAHWIALDSGYPTPKLDVRALILDDAGRLLLVQERSDGLWTLPGGWCDIGDSPADAVVELLSNVVYGVGQAAFLSDSSSTCTPSLNFTLFTTNVSSANPLSRFHFFFATSSSL